MGVEFVTIKGSSGLPSPLPKQILQGDLRGQIAVVLGGTGGLGAAVISELYRHGAKVVVVSRSADKVGSLKENLSGVASLLADEETEVVGCIASNGDATSEGALDEIARSAIRSYGKITSLLCLVGGNRPETTVMPDKDPLAIPYEAFQDTFELNFRDGFYNPLRAIGSRMVDALPDHTQRVSIVATSSMAALTPLSRVGAYGAAKAAMANYARWLAGELGRRHGDRVRVNMVTPGFVIADPNRRLLLDEDGTPTERGKQILAHTPFKRFGEASEIASAFVTLLSDRSSFMNGQEIVIDGGFSSMTI
jgi:NAD(P)-dependent dehydrogenase (short-subunit alcohol dehydrogenase family)